MFTGLIETVGSVARIQRAGENFRIEVRSTLPTREIALGDSIAVNGVCLTAVSLTEDTFSADASPETLSKTNLGELRTGSSVNLERAMRLGDRMGGHIVQGHVDGVGHLASIRADGNARIVTIRTPKELMPFLVPKGSICIDGISLTVNHLSDASSTFDVAIVPWTSGKVALLDRSPGWPVNLEVDILGKYVARLLQTGAATVHNAGASKPLSMETLRAHGFLDD